MKTISLKIFIVLSLFFPAFWSTFQEDYKMEYYAVFTAAYAVLLLYMLLCVLEGKWKKKIGFPVVLAGILVVYNVLSLYFNVSHLHWYGEQINNSIAVLFFIVLCMQQDGFDGKREELIKFFLGCAVLSNVLSIIYFFAGYTSFLVCNNQLYFMKLPADYYEFRHYWLYSHKSDYALMLTLFLAAAVRYRALFKSRICWGFSLLVFLTAMFLSHSWTGFGAAALVLAGGLLDSVDWKKIHFRLWYLAAAAAVLAAAGAAGKILLAERNIGSLGGRRDIWSGAVKEILANPGGWGKQFGERLFPATEYWNVNNAHNVFLNALLRFSIPVGICFTVMILLIMGYALWKSRTFLAAGLLLGLFALMNMDYCLLNYEVGMFLFSIYLICISRENKGKAGTESE